MNNIFFYTYIWRFFFMTTYHFIGIKGTGMSALAQILHDSGEEVQGSDVEKRFFTQEVLEEKNILILPFSESNIKDNYTVIAGNAFPEDHTEIQEAKKLGVKFYRYHEFLGEWLKQYTSIARSEEQRLNSSHVAISYAVFCLKKKT